MTKAINWLNKWADKTEPLWCGAVMYYFLYLPLKIYDLTTKS